MKLNILKATLLAALVGVSSCSDDYLDKKPTELLSADEINDAAETRPAVLIGFLNGLYSTMYTSGSGGTSNHDDFGQKGWDIYSDMLSQDMALAGVNYGWYSGLANFSATDNYTNLVNYKPWRYYYRIIYSANDLIKGFDIENKGLPTQPEAKANLGQALAIRANSYYNLLLLYVENIQDMSGQAIPLYIEPGIEAKGLSTTGEIFELIIDDLTKSSELLEGYERDAKFRINEDVSKAMLAYAYAAKGDDAMAAQVAKEVIDAGRYPLSQATDLVYDSATKSGGGFNDVNTDSWMWGQDITTDIGLDLVSWWGQVDVFTYSYAMAGDTKVIDAGLYDAIAADDIRKKQFNSDGLPIGKFYDPGREVAGQRTVVTDYIYMRMDEVYFLYAEESAKAGNDAEARRVLKELMNIRRADTSYIDGLSGKDLLDEILLQSRIEFWGEGKSYAIMKRNNETRVRGANHLFNVGEAFQATDSRLTLDIPQSEVQNNPNID
ncbi:MAG: RagB/SusD family nutrient uptake outer membrane protein [Weeksellaceae bacterium]